jgi:hypothetical protein
VDSDPPSQESGRRLKISSTPQNILSTLSPDPRVARRRAVEVGAAKARAATAEARAGSVTWAGDVRTGEWGAVEGGEAKTQNEGDDHPRKVTLKVLGARGTSLSGVCSVAGREKAVEGRVPKRYVYELGDGKLECEARNEFGRVRRVKLIGEGLHSPQQSDTSGGTVRVTFSGGDTSTSISSISQIVESSRGSSPNDPR